jgi:hypothetical protein
MISATPTAFLVEMLANEGETLKDVKVWKFDANKNHFGVGGCKALVIDGKEVYLEQNELTAKGHTFDGVEIPYANEKNKALYDDALIKREKGREKGVLLLDVSSPRVHVQGSIGDKAAAVQELYLKKNVRLIAATIDGTGIHVLLPEGLQAIGEIPDPPEGSKTPDDWQFSLTSSQKQKWRNNLIGDLLNSLDAMFGLSIPVFVFGYTKMRRGISFRSDKR